MRRCLILLLLMCAALPLAAAAQDSGEPIYLYVEISEVGDPTLSPERAGIPLAFFERLRDLLVAEGRRPVMLRATEAGAYPPFVEDYESLSDTPDLWGQALLVNLLRYPDIDAVYLTPFTGFEYAPLPLGDAGWVIIVPMMPDDDARLDQVARLAAGMALYAAHDCAAAQPYLDAAASQPLWDESLAYARDMLRFYQATCAAAAGDAEAAIDGYRAVLDSVAGYPADPALDQRTYADHAATNLAYLYLEQGEDDEARRILDAFAAVDLGAVSGREMERFLERADLYVALDDTGAAVTEITRLIDLAAAANAAGPSSFGRDEIARLYAERGWRYAQGGQVELAAADYERAIQADSIYPKTFFWRGRLRWDQGDLAGARVDFELFLALAPDYYNYYEDDLAPFISVAEASLAALDAP